ncbi:MAG: glycerol-3-phosphate responsive antiterminator [Clostridia bacterium]|nr:glycerol-3-phosphate responsive antiterminator [Clostridia bacterium]
MTDLQALLKRFEKSPVIAAVRSLEAGRLAYRSPAAAVFLLNASILDLEQLVGEAHDNDKPVFLHLDLTEGLGRDSAAVRWCIERFHVDGVISTRPNLLKAASDLGAVTIQRLFLMDTPSFEHGIRLLRNDPPDMAEILPGIAPKAIHRLCEALNKPVIAGGLVTEPREVALALQAGALAVSASEPRLWSHTLEANAHRR